MWNTWGVWAVPAPPNGAHALLRLQVYWCNANAVNFPNPMHFPLACTGLLRIFDL